MTTGSKWLALLKSRRLWLAIVAVAQTVVLQGAGVDPQVWQTINGVIAVVIAFVTVDDTATNITTTIHQVKAADREAAAKQ